MILDIDVEGAIAAAISAELTPEKVAAVVSKCAVSALESAVQKEFGYNGAMSKLLAEKISQAMPSDFGNMMKMADVVCRVVHQEIEQVQDGFIEQAVKQRIGSLLQPLPPVMKLSEIVKRIVETFSESEREGSSMPTVIVDQSTSPLTSSYWDIYIDPEEDKRKYSCAYQFRIRKCEDRDVYECWDIEQTTSKQPLFTGRLYKAEAIVFAINTGVVKIELDQTDFSDLYYESED